MDEFRELDNITGGEVHIGCAESHQIKYLAQAIKDFRESYPQSLFGTNQVYSNQIFKDNLSFFCQRMVFSDGKPPNVCPWYFNIVVLLEVWRMLAFERLMNTGDDSNLCFRPLFPRLETKMYIIWKKYQVFTPIAVIMRALEDLIPSGETYDKQASYLMSFFIYGYFGIMQWHFS